MRCKSIDWLLCDMNFRWFLYDFVFAYFGLSTNMIADFILLFHVKENLKEILNRTSFLFRFPHLPLVLNEPISGHLDVKDFSLLLPFTILSCGLRISSITHNFYSMTRNMGIATVINNSFYSISFLLFSLIFINEYFN